ncbi:MAG: DNA translocase FtsK, partial [Bacillota bacterium]|nr:DNA translocase FtsK [Bacillota bacterium]
AGTAVAPGRMAPAAAASPGGRVGGRDNITGLPMGAAVERTFPYELPPLGLLRRPPRQRPGRATQDAESRAQLLEDTFASFGVGVKVMEINPGPTVTRFEVRPAPGVKVSRIEALADDVALSLAAADVRIAPIPGKGLVGVEVPNSEVSTVLLREVLESAEFARSESRLSVAIGKDIAGQVIVADLQRMVHMLIAGATGSGKSVCLNSLIASLLFKATPSEVKLLLIDPKVVELQVFDGIPHLLAPVITDPKKASLVLRWAVKEMEDRYYRFSEVGARNIVDYNRLLSANRAETLADLLAEPEDRRAGSEPGTGDGWGGAPEAGMRLPHIVIVIDELADLMMVAPVEVETSIWRLAQMARAAGIHLVVATQRPSVNVITGVIKANIQSRIAFAVASQVDSRVILDMGGAEKLLGRGDMLFYPVGAGKPLRAQGALITDREVEDLVRHVKRQADPSYMDSFPVPEGDSGQDGRELDTRFADALRVVFDSGQASTSMLQRRLRVGYTRAARMVDMMEEMGVVGKSDGVKPRDVLMTMAQYVERFGPLDGDRQGPR